MIRYSTSVQSTIISTWAPVTWGLWGTMCRGDDHELEEGQIIPSCSMCSNSCLVIWRLSGANRHGRADVGVPVVSMWCLILCLTVVSEGEHMLVREGNLDNRLK